MTPSGVDIPARIRLRLARAAVQTLADGDGIEVIHLKGDALDPSLHPSPGSDVDILVRPTHVTALHGVLQRHGWRVDSTFEFGSPFGHAQTYHHDMWGYLDVHRRFPGIGIEDEAAFDRLWSARSSLDFAGVLCPVPSVVAQTVILLLNSARRRGRSRETPPEIWTEATPDRRAEVEAEVDALDAWIAFDAAFGRLDRHRQAPEYRLWKVASQGGGRFEEWWARVEAARGWRASLRVIAQAPRVNVDHLAHELDRRPTRRDIVWEFFARPVRGVREVTQKVVRRD